MTSQFDASNPWQFKGEYSPTKYSQNLWYVYGSSMVESFYQPYTVRHFKHSDCAFQGNAERYYYGKRTDKVGAISRVHEGSVMEEYNANVTQTVNNVTIHFRGAWSGRFQSSSIETKIDVSIEYETVNYAGFYGTVFDVAAVAPLIYGGMYCRAEVGTNMFVDASFARVCFTDVNIANLYALRKEIKLESNVVRLEQQASSIETSGSSVSSVNLIAHT